MQVGDAPDLVTSQANFNPALDFNGNNDYLQIVGGILRTNTYSDIWVYSVSKADNLNNGTLFREAASNGRLSVLNPWGTRSYIFVGGGSYSPFSGANTVDYNIWTHASSTGTATPSGFRKSISRDGAFVGAGTNGNSFVTGNGSNSLIGGGWDNGNGTSNNFNGQLAELIVYTGVPTALEQERIQSYLALKYGITKSSADNISTVGQDEQDYFSSDGSVIWDYSASTAHNNDIIAIGREDNTAFYQKQANTRDDSLIVHIGSLASSNQSNAGTISNDGSYLIMGNDKGELHGTATGDLETPVGIFSRFEREWKITNTNFNDTYSIEIEWDSAGPFHIDSVRLLVDLDGDFSDATVYSVSDGILFSNGSIIISGINTTHIPINSTRFITVGSVDTFGPLPIELLTFDAQLNDNTDVVLNWATASEINNDFFTIERSTNTLDWEVVKKEEGAGNSFKTIKYQAVDESPYPGTSYYRLKQTDFDGNFSYSYVESVSINSENALKVYPNPANDQLNIRGGKIEWGQISIYNLLGQDVTAQTQLLNRNETQLVVDISALKSGVYYVRAGSAVQKVSKQ